MLESAALFFIVVIAAITGSAAFERWPDFLLVPEGIMTTAITASHGHAAGKSERLVKDLKSVVVDADDLLKELAGSTAEGFSAARTKVEGRLSEARASLSEARIAVAERAKGIAVAGTDYAKENPWKVLGGAAAAGLIIGFLLRRRWFRCGDAAASARKQTAITRNSPPDPSIYADQAV
jgi:ElaB/YqjD/DUF883 family membrane-anchored ribosome-binding protein